MSFRLDLYIGFHTLNTPRKGLPSAPRAPHISLSRVPASEASVRVWSAVHTGHTQVPSRGAVFTPLLANAVWVATPQPHSPRVSCSDDHSGDGHPCPRSGGHADPGWWRCAGVGWLGLGTRGSGTGHCLESACHVLVAVHGAGAARRRVNVAGLTLPSLGGRGRSQEVRLPSPALNF